MQADSCCSGGTAYHTYTLFVRAVDNKGMRDPTPAMAVIAATTLLPQTQITVPDLPQGEFEITSGPSVAIEWVGADTDGEVVSYRYATKLLLDDPPHQPPPQDDTARWSSWSGEAEVSLDLAVTDPGNPWSFYVQSKDNCGASEVIFQLGRNEILINVED